MKNRIYFFVLANAPTFLKNPPKYALKCSKISCGNIEYQHFPRGHAPGPP